MQAGRVFSEARSAEAVNAPPPLQYNNHHHHHHFFAKLRNGFILVGFGLGPLLLLLHFYQEGKTYSLVKQVICKTMEFHVHNIK
jgi:hypothetical protein